ncbi:hypothetical protein [Bifidobacterium moukalabense]|uniref:hypothetical protein n=1 Tax=Bifidobacterium moukalabense TaxID=1333651 RepID=UPI001FCE8BDA|nr:hypothetical protein [Bifidobacterium moukalabense]
MLAQAAQYNAQLSQRALLNKTENENDRWIMTDARKQYHNGVPGRTCTYQVGQISVVLPKDQS